METGSLSKVEFIKQADRICTKSKADFEREYGTLAAENNNEIPPPEKVVGILVPTYDKLIDQISTLGPSPEEAQQATAFLSAIRRSLGKLKEHPKEVFSQLTPFKRAYTLATKHGWTGCANSLF